MFPLYDFLCVKDWGKIVYLVWAQLSDIEQNYAYRNQDDQIRFSDIFKKRKWQANNGEMTNDETVAKSSWKHPI